MFVSLYPYAFRTTARKYRQHDTTPPQVGLNSINSQFTPTTLLSERCAHVECAWRWVSVRVNPVSWSVVVRSRSFSSTVCWDMSPSLFVNCDVRSKEQYGHEIWISSYRARHTVHTQGIQKKARATLPWVIGSRLAVQNSFPHDLVAAPPGGAVASKPLRGRGGGCSDTRTEETLHVMLPTPQR